MASGRVRAAVRHDHASMRRERRTGREAPGQDALTLRFAGSAELQLTVAAAAGA